MRGIARLFPLLISGVMMLSVAEALAVVLEHAKPLQPTSVDVGPAALGLVLTEPILCDLDSPPFAKAMMDGYALRSSDAPGTLTVIEEVLAGQVPRKPVAAGQATRIMTGAPMPAGADAVVMVERTQFADGRVTALDPIKAGKNVLPRGAEMTAGDTIFNVGHRIRPEEVGVLAGMGRALVKVHPRPTVSVITTGDEIIEVWEKPGPGQIRNSNGRMLLAQVARAGGSPRGIGIARDNEPHLRQLIAEGLENDALVLSGGVSAGKVDLVPAVLASMGVQALVQKVRMKPGKPMYFGIVPRDGRGPKLVFGLPGNPVSSLVCFELFVRPAIRRLTGLPTGPTWVRATLEADADYPTDRPTYHPARLRSTDSGWRVRPTPWFGSPDLRGVTAGNAFVLFDAGEGLHRAGEVVNVLVCDDGIDSILAGDSTVTGLD